MIIMIKIKKTVGKNKVIGLMFIFSTLLMIGLCDTSMALSETNLDKKTYEDTDATGIYVVLDSDSSVSKTNFLFLDTYLGDIEWNLETILILSAVVIVIILLISILCKLRIF